MNAPTLPPAIVIAGPPHSGKSVLAYSLAQALDSRKRAFYLMRTAPDGEGNFSSEAPRDVVQDIRIKGKWTERWVNIMCRDLSRRVLPLLVDIGGRPTPDQEHMLDTCTAAIVLTPNEDERRIWLDRMRRRSVPVIADLHSDLGGVNRLIAREPVLRGVLAGLERGARAAGPVFDALLDEVEHALGNDSHDVWLARHLAQRHSPSPVNAMSRSRPPAMPADRC